MSMKFSSIYSSGQSNNAFFADNYPTHTYAPTYTSRLLRSDLIKHGIEMNTADLNLGKEVSS
jgi:hypothetical protein